MFCSIWNSGCTPPIGTDELENVHCTPGILFEAAPVLLVVEAVAAADDVADVDADDADAADAARRGSSASIASTNTP